MNKKYSSHSKHNHFMDRCIQLANRAMLEGNPPVGSVLVKNGEIIAEGIEAGKSSGDVTAHAEIEVIRSALLKGIQDFCEYTMYSTHEPCVMCSYVIRHYQIRELVYGVEVDELGGESSRYPLLTDRNIAKWNYGPNIVKGIKRQNIEKLSILYQERKIKNK
ncbi:MAG: nucleoside deaminase [Balneolaceae bacterium]